jgi:starch synthase
MTTLRVLSVTSELFPFVKTGGLADVTGALPMALAAEGVAVRTLVPGYPGVMNALREAEVVHGIADLDGAPARLLAAKVLGLDLLVLDAPHLYTRVGNPYLGPDGKEWSDNALRFAALARVAAAVGRGLVPAYQPDVVHAHDWQTGLAPAFLHYGPGPRPATVMTVHNLAFQGQFPVGLLTAIGLPPHAFAIDGVEYYGQIGYLKAGLQLADRITTVSPSYAAEIRTPEFGMGLDGLLRQRTGVLSGILNGIDLEVWNAATDPYLMATFGAGRLAGRAANKAELQRRLGLAPRPDALVFGVVSRLTWQKGIDLLHDVVPTIAGAGAQLALLGSGDRALEVGFIAATRQFAGSIGVEIGYDESLAHLIQGGADALLVPSRFEPCGLTQLCALRYGSVPVVARVGGLADTIIDANAMALAAGTGTGVMFAPPNREMLEAALGRTHALWRDRKTWQRIQERGMATDVGWSHPARQYADLFRDAVGERARRHALPG